MPIRYNRSPLISSSILCDISGPNSPTHLRWTPIPKWYVVTCGSKNGHQKYTCLTKKLTICSKYVNHSRLNSPHYNISQLLCSIMWDQVLGNHDYPLIPCFLVYGSTQVVYYRVFDKHLILCVLNVLIATSFFGKKPSSSCLIML